MIKNKLIERLLIFFIGIPLVIGFVCVEYKHHLPLHILIIAFSFLASYELYDILSSRQKMLPKPFVLILNLITPLSAFLCSFFELPPEYITYSFTLTGIIVFAEEAFFKNNFTDSNLKISGSFLVIFYSGFLVSFISRMTFLTFSTEFIATFLFIVFITDSFAWLFGMLFGHNNRNIVAASPNKSLAGFLGGYAGAIASAYLARAIWPNVFSTSFIKPLLLGCITATASIIGDLVESVFKRSAEVKDSGTIIPGRGGVLDSVDSIFAAAPIYFFLIKVLYL